MPTVLRWRGHRCFFYSNEAGEPPHVHVRKDDCEAKIWLDDVSVAVSVGFADHELGAILRMLGEQRDELLERWHDYFGN